MMVSSALVQGIEDVASATEAAVRLLEGHPLKVEVQPATFAGDSTLRCEFDKRTPAKLRSF